ncbi:MAG: hypothetical protein ACLRFL_01635 [Clostridia bacterium]
MAERKKSANEFFLSDGKMMIENMEQLHLQIFGDMTEDEKVDIYRRCDDIAKIATRLKDDEKIDIYVKIEYVADKKIKGTKKILLSNLVKNGLELPPKYIDMINITGKVQFTIGGAVCETAKDIIDMHIYIADTKDIDVKYSKLSDNKNFYALDVETLETNGLIRVAQEEVGL